MSTLEDTTMAQSEQTVAVEAAELRRLHDRLDDLEAESERLRAENDQLRERVGDLEDQVEQNTTDFIGLSQDVTPMRKLLIGDGHDDPTGAMRAYRDAQGPINQQLAEYQRTVARVKDDINADIEREVGVLRAKHGAMIRELAAETGVDLDLSHGDTITQLREQGVDAVLANPRKRDRRAQLVLENITEWGDKEHLRFGAAYRLPRPRVKRLLNGTDGIEVTMTSKTVGDVFDSIEQLSEGLTRPVKRRKEDGTDVLYVGFPETEET